MTTATTDDRNLIKDETLAFYQAEHTERPKGKEYGTTGARNAGDQVFDLVRSLNRPLTVLDYGAGTGSLVAYVREQCEKYGCHVPEFTLYDPAIPAIAEIPEGRTFDIVTSSDVMEHIEPDCLDDVLAHLDALCTRTQFHS
ncbi:MAG: class I SAM-dependent methyltransferase, partial [Planctomycetota bacterium]